MAINVRDFERDSPSSITFGSGSWTSQLGNANHSIAAIIKLESTGVAQTILDAYESGGPTMTEFFINSSNQLCVYHDNFGVTAVGATALSSGVWYLVGYSLTHASDGRVRFHIYNYNTTTWTHADDDQIFTGNPTTVIFRVGNTGGTSGGAGGAFDGQMLIMGISDATLSDANFETLEDDGTGGTFTDWLSHFDTVWRFDQAANTTDVLDLDTFNADETAESNTTVASVTEPSGWGEDGGGGGTAVKDMIGAGYIPHAR